MGKWPDFEYHGGKYDQSGFNSSHPSLGSPLIVWCIELTSSGTFRSFPTCLKMVILDHFLSFSPRKKIFLKHKHNFKFCFFLYTCRFMFQILFFLLVLHASPPYLCFCHILLSFFVLFYNLPHLCVIRFLGVKSTNMFRSSSRAEQAMRGLSRTKGGDTADRKSPRESKVFFYWSLTRISERIRVQTTASKGSRGISEARNDEDLLSPPRPHPCSFHLCLNGAS